VNRTKSRRTKLSAVQRRIVAEITRLQRRGEPLNITAVKRSHPELIEAAYAIRPFWGWKQAIEAAGIDYTRIKVRLEPYVKCEVCGEYLAALSTHLIVLHGLTLDKYRQDYPESELVSEDLRAKLWSVKLRRQRGGSILPHWEPLWSEQYALDRLAELHRRGVDLSVSALSTRDPVMRWASKHFGSWDATLRRAGIDPATVRKLGPYRTWTRQLVLDEIGRRHAHGLPLSTQQLERGEASDPVLRLKGVEFFGSWRNAIRAAGLDYSKILAYAPRKYPTRASVTKEIRRRQREGFAISYRAVCGSETRDSALVNSAIRYFGTWRRAVESAGFRYEHIRANGPKYRNADDVLREIRGRRRQGVLSRLVAVTKGPHADMALWTAAKRLFGGWRQAVRSAGVVYDEHIRPSKYPTRASIVSEIRRRHRAGLPLNSEGVRKLEPRDASLHDCGCKVFGSWRAAVEAAGFDYDCIRNPGRAPYRTRDQLLKAIRRRVRQGLPMTWDAVACGKHPDSALHWASRKLFGSWPAAKRAAGVGAGGHERGSASR
jgi:hypothetical protein